MLAVAVMQEPRMVASSHRAQSSKSGWKTVSFWETQQRQTLRGLERPLRYVGWQQPEGAVWG